MDYRKDAKEVARKSVMDNIEIVSKEMFDRGYMYYDEFEITNTAARYIADILNEMHKDYDEVHFQECEEMVENEGACGIIYNTRILNVTKARKKIHEHYT